MVDTGVQETSRYQRWRKKRLRLSRFFSAERGTFEPRVARDQTEGLQATLDR